MNSKLENNMIQMSLEEFDKICYDYFSQGYWYSEEINNATSFDESDLQSEMRDCYEQVKLWNEISNKQLNSDKFYYKFSKEFLDEILSQAIAKRNNYEFPNESFIEANACIDTIEHIVQNSKII